MNTQPKHRDAKWLATAAATAAMCVQGAWAQDPPPETAEDQDALICVLSSCAPNADKNQPVPALSAYKDSYFDLGMHSWGRNRPSLWMFRFGLKTPLWTSKNRNGVFLGYRMTAYWDIDTQSAPFRDINHTPSVFWLQRWSSQKAPVSWLSGFEAGVEHISNGVDNASTGPNGTGVQRSRSIDYAFFAEPRLSWSVGGTSVVYQPRLWIPIGTSENPDIRKHWGLLWNTVSMGEMVELSTRGNPFGQGQVGLRLHADPNWLLGTKSLPFKLSLGVFHGRGDGLLQYTSQRTWARLGLSFSPYAN
jgi:outer membrane phospholipase A